MLSTPLVLLAILAGITVSLLVTLLYPPKSHPDAYFAFHIGIGLGVCLNVTLAGFYKISVVGMTETMTRMIYTAVSLFGISAAAMLITALIAGIVVNEQNKRGE